VRLAPWGGELAWEQALRGGGVMMTRDSSRHMSVERVTHTDFELNSQ